MSTITRITTVRVDAEVRPELRMISSLGTHTARYTLVRLEDSDGAIGWGEASATPNWSGETPESVVALIENYFTPALIGRDPDDIEGALRVMDTIAVGNPFTKSAVEMALWDRAGRVAGQPLWRLLYPGATPQPIPLRGSIAAVEPDGAAARARWFLERGLTAVKVKVGPGGGDADVARVRAVREAVGPTIPLGVDANGAWSADEAAAIVRRLEPLGLQYVEQPTPRGDFPALRRVRERIGPPVMADESVWTDADLTTLLALDAADIVSVYPGKMGGIAPTIALARRAADAGKLVYIGSNLERDPGTAAMAHLAVGLPGADFERLHADIIGTLYFKTPLTDPPLAPVDGAILPPDRPGLGVDPRLG